MHQTMQINFPPFRLDTANEQLWRGSNVVGLRPKAFCVLRYLLERPGRLHTKDALLDACWPATAVSDTVLKVCIREIRAALGDDPQTPRFIETAHRRGYRFVGQIAAASLLSGAFRHADTARLSLAHRLDFLAAPLTGLVGRDGSLAQLRGRLNRASQGERQLLFVTGEAGIGKSTLVEAFLQSLTGADAALLARGQCLEQWGPREPYLPMLEACARLCRDPEWSELLKRYAPAWLQFMPALNHATPAPADSAPPARMLRELAEALEALTARRLLVLVLEDVHWADPATVDLLAALARRRGPARLLIVATYRPVDLTLAAHPLRAARQELEAHKLCKELALGYLGEEAISALLKSRFAPHDFPAALPRVLQERTGGNPLFLNSALDYLLTQRLIDERDGRWRLTCRLAELELDVPASIHALIEKQLAELSPAQQRALAAAAVIGMEFSAATVAGLLDEAVPEVEAACDALAALRHFLRPLEPVQSPDGTVAARYGFVHAVHQNALAQRVTPARRARWQQQFQQLVRTVSVARP